MFNGGVAVIINGFLEYIKCVQVHKSFSDVYKLLLRFLVPSLLEGETSLHIFINDFLTF